MQHVLSAAALGCTTPLASMLDAVTLDMSLPRAVRDQAFGMSRTIQCEYTAATSRAESLEGQVHNMQMLAYPINEALTALFAALEVNGPDKGSAALTDEAYDELKRGVTRAMDSLNHELNFGGPNLF